MSVSIELGERHEVELPQGALSYREAGAGPPIVFLHGLWLNGDHWRKLVPLLADSYRCITPDLPMGGHERPLKPDADVSPRGVVELIADLIAALDLDGVTIVANDTGVALLQVLITERPERVAAAVAVSGDVFTNFLPWVLKPMRVLGFVPGGLRPAAAFWHTRVGQRILWFFLMKGSPPADVCEGYFGPATRDAGVRRDLAKFLRGARPRVTLRAARRLQQFERPVLVVWTRARRIVFPPSHGPRLAARLPQARLEWVEDSHAFVQEDQPERLAELLRGFLGEVHPRAEQADGRALA